MQQELEDDEKLISDATHHMVVGGGGFILAIFVTMGAYISVVNYILNSG